MSRTNWTSIGKSIGTMLVALATVVGGVRISSNEMSQSTIDTKNIVDSLRVDIQKLTYVQKMTTEEFTELRYDVMRTKNQIDSISRRMEIESRVQEILRQRLAKKDTLKVSGEYAYGEQEKRKADP